MLKNSQSILFLLFSISILHTQSKLDKESLSSLISLIKDTPDSCSTENGLPKIIDKEHPRSNRLKLECFAPYPIEWDIHENNKNAMMVRQYVITKGDIFNSKTKCYNSTLIALSSELNAFTRTGNYTCRSIFDRSLSSSLYKFIWDKGLLAYPSSEFFNDKTEVREVLTMKNGEFIIPCRSNVEHVNATLTKIETPKVLVLTMNDYVRYDPKVGFIINSTSFPFNPLGEYECELFIEHTSERSSAIVNLIKDLDSHEFEVTPNTEHVSFNSIEHTKKFICLAKEEVYLDISNTDSLQTFITHRESPIFEKALAKVNKTVVNVFHYKASATVAPKPLAKGQVFCKTASNNTILHTWNFDLQKSCECVWNSSLPLPEKHAQTEESFEVLSALVWDDILRTVKGTIACTAATPNRSVYSSVEFHACHNPTECENSVVCREKRYCSSHTYYDRDIIEFYDPSENIAYINNASQHHYIFFKQLHSGIVECTIDQYSYRIKAYADLDSLVFKPEDMKQNVNVTKLEKFVFKKDPQVFRCEIVTFFLSGDLRWAFKNKNNTLSFIDPGSQIRIVQEAIANKLISTITLEIEDSGVDSVYCFAPVWGSKTNEWRNSSAPVTVEDQDSEEYKETRAKQKCQDEHEMKTKIPVIFMERYTETATKNFTSLWKATNNEFILRQWTLSKRITLVCRAQYPIEWYFEAKKMNSTSISYHTKSGEKTHMCFQSKIVIYDTITKIHGYDSIMDASTGKYVCSNTHHAEKVESSTYIYRYYDQNFPLINHGQHINLEVETHHRESNPKSWTVFPCRVTHPSVNVSLYTFSNGKYKELKKSDKVKFTPSAGFSVENSMVEFSNQYICTTKLKDESHTVSFSLVSKPEAEHIPSKTIQIDTGDSSKTKGKGKSGRSNQKMKLYIVSITAGVLVLALVVVILFMFRAIRNQQRTIRDLNDGLSVSYTQARLRESNPAFMEDVNMTTYDRTVRPSSNYERF